MSQDINAGELIEVNCPARDSPDIALNSKYPSKEQASVKVVKIENEKIFLGPLRAGDILVNIPCPSAVVEVKAYVKELDPETASQRFQSLSPSKMEYPPSLYWVILAIFLALITSALAYLMRKKPKAPIIVQKMVAKDSPRVKLEKSLSYMQSNVYVPESQHFQEIYKNLRRFIEKELNMKTRSLTTKEFIGVLRALGTKNSVNQNLIAQLEHVLNTSDLARFTSKSFQTEEWKSYLQNVKAISHAFLKEKTDELA